VLALPASRGDQPPKDKDGKKESSVKEQYAALVKEFGAKQREVIAAANKAKGEEQDKLWEKYDALGKDYSARFLKLADADPTGDTGADALFWIVQNAAGSPEYKTATERVQGLIARLPAKDLVARLKRTRASEPVLAAVLKRAEADEKDPAAADLLAWAATSGFYLPAGEKAVRRLVDKYPDHSSMERVCQILGRGRPDDADILLHKILDHSADKSKVKAAANLGLGQLLAGKADKATDKAAGDKVAAEAEKYLTAAIDLYAKGDKEDENVVRLRKSAEGELRALRTLRVGMVVPEIKAPDLDGKEFKLSDYRGKVVLLDFWGNW
jgi:hypothetical protein